MTLYDYGQGGVWAYIEADSAAEVQLRYPELELVAEAPQWMTPEFEQRVRRNMTIGIDEVDHPFLAAIIRSRT